MRKSNNKLSLATKLTFGIGDFYGGASCSVIALLFVVFINTVAGISIGTAGLIVLAGKAIDAITDPIMGTITDNTKSRFGRRAIWFLLGVIPVALSFVMMWIVPATDNYTAKVVYYFFAYAIFSCAFTMVMVPYGSLPQELTDDDKERSVLVTFRMAFSVLGVLIAAVLPTAIINSFGTGKKDASGSIIFNSLADKQHGYVVMAIVLAAIFALIWIVMFFVMKGRGTEKQEEIKTTPFLKSLKTCIGNPAFLLLCLIYLLAFTPADIMSSNFVFYLTYNVKKADMFTYAMGVLMISVALSFPLYLAIIKKYGRRITFIAGSIFRIGSVLLLLTINESTSVALLIFVSFMIGVGTGVAYAIPWAMLTEMTDLDEAKTGYRQEGVYSGVMTFIRKLSSGIAIYIVTAMLDAVHFDADAIEAGTLLLNNEMTRMILICLTAIPIAMIVLGIISAILYPMSLKRLAYVRSVVKLRRSGVYDTLSAEEKNSIDVNLKKLIMAKVGNKYNYASETIRYDGLTEDFIEQQEKNTQSEVDNDD